MTNYDKSLVLYHQRLSMAAEAYRALRTNLLFFWSKNRDCPQTIVITSSKKGEGKSVISANTALVLAQSKHRTLLVDADMRKPQIHEIFGLEPFKGLRSILDGIKPFEECVQHTDIPELDLLLGELGDIEPTELLSSIKLKEFISEVSQKYDFIIFDTPPIGVLTDAALIATQTNYVLFVVAEGITNSKEIKISKKQLNNIGANILGIVYNRANSSINNYDYYRYDYKNSRIVTENKISKIKKSLREKFFKNDIKQSK